MTQKTLFGGIDGGKDALDLAVFPGGDRGRVTNTRPYVSAATNVIL
jgi:hypothetical protein